MNETSPDPIRADFYKRAAAHALAEAITFRNLARRTGAPIDREIMRTFANSWLRLTRRAREFGA